MAFSLSRPPSPGFLRHARFSLASFLFPFCIAHSPYFSSTKGGPGAHQAGKNRPPLSLLRSLSLYPLSRSYIIKKPETQLANRELSLGRVRAGVTQSQQTQQGQNSLYPIRLWGHSHVNKSYSHHESMKPFYKLHFNLTQSPHGQFHK